MKPVSPKRARRLFREMKAVLNMKFYGSIEGKKEKKP